MTDLEDLESRTIYILREAFYRFKRLGLLWSMGKDSTTLLWMCRKAFFGEIPFPVLHIDTSYKFPEIYDFRERLATEWKLDLRITKNEAALASGMNKAMGVLACCGALKTEGLHMAMKQNDLNAIILGIRRDEHGVRAKERYFSQRDENSNWNYREQSPELWSLYRSGTSEHEHLRVHPLLHWSELDIWRYIEQENLPVNPLYFAQAGQRYRSIGCAPCCSAVASEASSVNAIVSELRTTTEDERSGRSQDKESVYTMQKLRSLGYM